MLESINFDGARDRTRSPLISIVVPVLNEQDGISPFVKGIDAAIASGWDTKKGEQAPRLEIVFVDDGSLDDTARVVREHCRTDKRVKLVRLSRNFGKEAALSAGLKAASGDAAVPMDVDLQDPPDLLRPMIECWQNGAQVVNARRTDRMSDTILKRSSSRAFYKVMSAVSDFPIEKDVGDFRLLDRVAINALSQLGEHHRFNKGLFSWIGFRSETIEYARPARAVGSTKWNFSKLLGLAIDGIVSSTTLPLRVWTFVGGTIAMLAFVYAAFLILNTMVRGVETPGYASLMVVVLFLGGINLFSLGLLGEYIGRVAMQVRGRPLYIISETEGF